jgi:hypothetical protein
MKLQFSRQIFEKYPNVKYNENPSSGRRVIPSGQTDVQTTWRFFQFNASTCRWKHSRWMAKNTAAKPDCNWQMTITVFCHLTSTGVARQFSCCQRHKCWQLTSLLTETLPALIKLSNTTCPPPTRYRLWAGVVSTLLFCRPRTWGWWVPSDILQYLCTVFAAQYVRSPQIGLFSQCNGYSTISLRAWSYIEQWYPRVLCTSPGIRDQFLKDPWLHFCDGYFEGYLYF